MRKRTISREIALKVLYACDISKDSLKDTIEKFWLVNNKFDENIIDFSNSIVFGINEYFEQINNIISESSANWTITRMATIDRNILRIACFELLYHLDTPEKVIMNEAINLAKKYGDENSSKFVNGMLDKINKEYRIKNKK